MQKTFKRVLAVALSTVMAASAFSISAAAYNKDYKSETHTVFKHTEQTLAPGVEYYNNYAYSADGKQMVYYVSTADISRDDVVVQTSYLNQYKDKQPGMSKLSEQIAFANQYYTDSSNPLYLGENYNVVSGVNASFYNMQTGQPSGVCFVDGVDFGTNAYPCFFAILKDGTAVMDDRANKGNYTGETAIWQAVGGSQWLVRDGEDVTANISGDYNTDRHSRTCVGITEDGKVVLMVLDGRQEPFSCGGTMHELAQIMIEADCKYAMNIDGGGSTTFAARPEGEDDVKIINRPSDGSERSISSGLIIASLAAPSNVFDRVAMTAEDEYVTPGTSTNITVTGVSASGSSADIPAEVTYEAENGTISDGVFTAGNTAGDAVVKAVYNGEVVGSTTIHVAVPDSIAFTSENFTIPYGKSAELGIEAKTGLNVIKTKPSDFTFTVTDAASGTLDGFTFTAAEESDIASTTITAAYNGTELTASAGLVFGKGSEVIFDFEDGTTNGFGLSYSNYNYYLPNSKVFVANKDNGQVHSGNYALGLNIDYSNSQESGYQMTGLYQGKTSGNINYYPGAIKLGTWLYIPDEYVGLWVRWTVSPITAVNDDGTYTLGSITSNAMDNGAGGTGVVYSFDEPGWHYLTADLSQYKGLGWRDFYYCMQFYISDRDGASYGYYAKDNHNINGDFTVYMDDVTLDYSTVVEDREAPVFSSVILGDEGPHSNEGMTLTNGYVSDGYSKLDLSARVAENTSKSNYSGLNASTAKVYIDGNEVASNFANGIISAANAYDFAEGQHSVKFVIYDNAGNRASATRFFSVTNVDKAESVKVVAHDPSLDRILHGSLYWVDVVAENAEKIDTVTTTLNLDSMSKWELDHMTVADGFEASYEVVDAGDKIVKLTIKNNGSNLAGEQALVSMPIRAWELDNSNKRAALTDKEWTYAEFKASKEFWPVATEVRIQQGEVNFTDGAKDSFTGENVFVWSESWANYANMTKTQEGKDYYNAWNGGHIHNTTVTKEAKAATCTEDGWTEETFCEECNSVVKWSETVPATGHDFELDLEQGKIVCKICGEVNTAYTGLIEKDGTYYYAQLGVLSSGWKLIDDNWYYFDTNTGHNVPTLNNGKVTFEFENNGKLVEGKWLITDAGRRYYYGPSYYKHGWVNIDGADYYFGDANKNPGYCYTGKRYVINSNTYTPQWYDFGEEGKAEKITDTGLLTTGAGTYYLVEGVSQTGLQLVDGKYYYFTGTYEAKKGLVNVSESKTNGLLPSGYYLFGDDYVMVDGEFATWSGAERYIKQGQPYFAGVIKNDNGEIMYIGSDATLKTGICTISNGKGNGILDDGTYLFDENGVLTDNTFGYWQGRYVYFKDGQPDAAGPVIVDGKKYYIRSGCQPATGLYHVSAANANEILPEGTYLFDETGVLVDGEFGDWNGKTLYIKEGQPYFAGVIEHHGHLIYVDSSCQQKTGVAHITTKTGNGILAEGYYLFNDDGLADNEFGTWTNGKTYYFANGQRTAAGVVEIDGNVYFINGNCQAATGYVHVTAAKGNGILPEGDYTFGDDGVLVE